MSAACSDAELYSILDNNSTKKYYVEHSGYKTNHLAHGAVAIARLGGSSQRVRQYIQSYVTIKNLEDPEKFADENRDVTLSVEQLKGQHRSYYVIVDHYLGLLQTYDSLEAFVAKEFPKLIPGMLGAAFHGLIQMAYGLVAGHGRVVCEGFAYLHHSYLPLKVSEPSLLSQPLGTPGDTDILDVLEEIRLNKDFTDLVQAIKGKITGRAGALLAQRGDELVNYVNRTKLPEYLDLSGQDVLAQKDAILKWVVDCSILVYLLSERRNDFFLLHGVTGAWSLKVVLATVSDPQVIVSAVRVFFCSLMSVYVAQASPRLDTNLLPPGHARGRPWEEIIRDTLSSERDTHIYKLVQVCRDMDSENSDPVMAAVYKEAAEISLKFALDHGSF